MHSPHIRRPSTLGFMMIASLLGGSSSSGFPSFNWSRKEWPEYKPRTAEVPHDAEWHIARAKAKRQRKKLRREINDRRSKGVFLNLGDYSATPVGYGRLMGCSECMVEWTGCWDNFLCPICGEGELPRHHGSWPELEEAFKP